MLLSGGRVQYGIELTIEGTHYVHLFDFPLSKLFEVIFQKIFLLVLP